MLALYAHGPKDIRLQSFDLGQMSPGDVHIAVERGGICGSDLHYYKNGGFGNIRLREPMILGHEVSGRVLGIGADVRGISVGDLVAISPSRPCYGCGPCKSGLQNQCENMRFYGSAMPFPHIQGAFRQEIIARADQCVVANGLTAAQAAMAEPLSVAIHAVARAGDMVGKSVLVTGCGPIGILSIIMARRAGASRIMAVDIVDDVLNHARSAGADEVANTLTNSEALQFDTPPFDVLFECSGAPQALHDGIHALRSRGKIIQLGLTNDVQIPLMRIIAKELSLIGSFRFHQEFATAIDLMQRGLVDVSPLVTHSFDLHNFETAFEMALDRSQAMKVQLELSE